MILVTSGIESCGYSVRCASAPCMFSGTWRRSDSICSGIAQIRGECKNTYYRYVIITLYVA